MSESELNTIFTHLDRVLVTDARQAFTMPGAFYTSEALLDIEREQLFRKKWICLGREEEIPVVGDYFSTELVGEPIMLVRVKARTIKALANVCRHRAMPLVEGRGRCKRFTCSYHAWTYDLSGQLVRAPGVEDQHANFIRNCKLPEFKCEIWHGFIFVNLDSNAESFIDSETVRQIEPMVKNMHIEDMQLLFSIEQEWDANWKCLVENFLEGYHLSTVHRKTLHPYTPTRLSKHFNPGEDFFGFHSYYPKQAPSRGESHTDLSKEEKRRSLMLGIGPSSVFGISGFKVTYNLIQPISATRLRTRIGMIGLPAKTNEEKCIAEAGVDLFTRTFAEDEAQLVRVMRGLQSRNYTSSVLAKPDYEGAIWDFYNYLAENLSR
ncbi:MAG: phenylpropionate dioxygenase-like ring-hydroxylating dioxygenase large terminal subunit [Parasphingorhabdus sp.]|jgi:phenylpropionate dioxygenase-like ring-hydroxylating dioxygenase large terminal subunit